MEHLRRIEDGAARLVLTDPPYGIGYKSTLGERVANDDAPYIWWLREAWRVLAPRSALFCFCRWDVEDTFKMAIRSAGFEVRNQAVWDKQNRGMGDTRRTLAPAHEVILFAVKGDFTWPGGRPSTMFRWPRPHWKHGRTHPTEKPVGLLAELIAATTRPGDMVVDPFAGSGSTGEAAVRLGRAFWGCELDPTHARQARARLTRARRSMPA